ncbi:MAG: type II methionyl aminopeptidase [Candidatus Aenigmarchaeota archaeon]|nr:type II methionyl aminopeptidase [Candidatus Aenigmarchaeota archaeon]MDW8149794.1 type II methionyl aminopeptidase [Candidatus Aenigmarchaeota archaeon]
MIEEYKSIKNIAWKVMENAEKVLDEKKNILEIAEFLEKNILELGAEIAFPVNICVNHIAAHYTADINETYILKKGDVVKIDIGCHINGFIVDIAKTFCIKENNEMIKIVDKCLEEAKKVVKEGNKISEVGYVVEEIIKDTNLKVIRNLTGHRIDKFGLHAKPSIPNYKNFSSEVFEKDNIYAIEIFLTNGNGWVKESTYSNIFQFNKYVGVRNETARKILELADKKFKRLPFAKRWLKEFSLSVLEFSLNELLNKNALKKYPVLIEDGNGIVVQAEDTFFI